MKVAVFSDVQGNLPAMEVAVEQIRAETPNLVVMAGDLINRGPSSLACLELFEKLCRQSGWVPLKGNHEAWILRCAREAPKSALDEATRRFADWTLRQIRPRLDTLREWPDHLCFHGGREDTWVHVTHGTMLSNRQGITANLSDEDLSGAVPEDVALFVTAHTHRPLERLVHGVPVLNVGSVGSPFDGDTRGSYALLELDDGEWRREIVRFEYDREQAERDFIDSGFIDEGGPLARILFEEWRLAKLLMPSWRRDFEPAVLAGERPLQPAVDAFLASIERP